VGVRARAETALFIQICHMPKYPVRLHGNIAVVCLAIVGSGKVRQGRPRRIQKAAGVRTLFEILLARISGGG
jgi:hypothetical protein